MSDLFHTGGRLAVICVVASLCLGVVNAITEPAIARVKEQALAEALDAVAFGGSVGEFVENPGDSTIVGSYPLSAEFGEGLIVRLSAVGYGGEMMILAAFDMDGGVRAVTLMENQETPGLGKEAERTEYMDKYLGTGDEVAVPTSKNDLSQAEADAITGATITFTGIGEALAAGSAYVKEVGGTP